jgi:NAD(P)H dehydrogenase (quinone)
VIEAAKENGVKHILYTSFLRVSENTPGIFHDHYVTETEIKASGMAYTIFRNTFYNTVLPMLAGDSLKTGQLVYPSGNAKINLASREDMAEAIANVALNPAMHANKVYEITSGRAYSFAEIAGMLGEASGKQITYTDLSLEEMKAGMKKAGMPEQAIGMTASIARTISSGYFDYTDDSLEQLLQRKPVDLKDTIAQFVGNQAKAGK